jgi:hypothetical protein
MRLVGRLFQHFVRAPMGQPYGGAEGFLIIVVIIIPVGGSARTFFFNCLDSVASSGFLNF